MGSQVNSDMVSVRKRLESTQTNPNENNAECEQSHASQSVHRLFEEHNSLLVKYVQGYVGTWNEAEEVAQEAYVRILGLDQAETISHLRAYLYRTARNIAIDHLRKRRHKEVSGLQMSESDSNGEVGAASLESAVIAQEKIERIKALVRELPPKCQMAFICYKFRGQSFGEVAARLSVSESMVRKYVKRGLAYCQERLESEDE